MWESTESYTFAYTNFTLPCWLYNDPKYYNVTDWDDCICNATFKADPDIAGIGVITSFASIPLCTVIVAIVPAYYDTVVRLPATLRTLFRSTRDDPARQFSSKPAKDIEACDAYGESLTAALNTHRRHRWLMLVATNLLGNLWDLQLFNATAISVAILAQGSDMTFYHRELAANYFWFTLDAFLAVRREDTWPTVSSLFEAGKQPSPLPTPLYGQQEACDTRFARNGRTNTNSSIAVASPSVPLPSYLEALRHLGDRSNRLYLRRLIIIVCITLFLVTDTLSVYYAKTSANELQSGKCFIAHDRSPFFITVLLWTNLAICIVVLLCLLFSRGKGKVYNCRNLMVAWQTIILRKAVNTRRECEATMGHSRARGGGCIIKYAKSVVSFLLYTLAIVYIVFVQLVVIGTHSFDVLLTLGMWAWTFYDVIDIKISNRHLVEGSEMEWGFGQVLAVVLMGMPFFNLLDVLNRELGGIKEESQE